MVTSGFDWETIFVPDKEGIRMDGRIVRSDLHFIFDKYWFCKKYDTRRD